MTNIGLRTRTRFAQWNVRTLYQSGKLAQLTSECKRLRIDVLGISEMRWNTSGEKRTADGSLVIYSGMNSLDDPHVSGVGIYFSRKIKSALLEWHAVSDRIITARLNSKSRKITIVQCYAPTEESELQAKEQFYSLLDRTLTHVNRNDLVILMGDFNARIGNNNTGIEHVIGKHGIGERNENGELLIEMCSNHGLMIGGSIFMHKDVHKTTWVAPNPTLRDQKFQIDHICVSRRWIRTLLDVRNKRSAEIGSDHYLVMAEMRLKASSVVRKHNTNRQKFQIGKLQENNIKSNFSQVMRMKYEDRCRTNSATDVRNLWENTKASILEAATETLGKATGNNAEWLSAAFWQLVESRKSKKDKLLSQPNTRSGAELRREIAALTTQIKRQARADKRAYGEKLAREAEIAASKGNLKEVFNITRKLSSDNNRRIVPLKDRNGNLITMEEEQLKAWRDHFEKTFNVLTNNNDIPNIGQHRRPLRNICTEPPSKVEISEAIRSLKNGKSAGIDNIPAECLKADVDSTTEMLYPLFRNIWHTEVIPSEWKESIIVKLPKKGNLSDCNNWRGIALLSVVSKVFNKVILGRIMEPLNAQLRKQQSGFRPNRSCIDNINSMRIIIEQCIEFNHTLYAVFVDYEKAFDSIKRECIWLALERMGVPQKIISIIRKSYEGSRCKVLHNGKLSDSFASTTGVKQGCILSPLLFIVVLDWVLEIFESQNRGINWRLNASLEDLDYADDLVLLSHTHQHMQSKLSQLQQESLKFGLKINTQKTEALRIKSNNTTCFTIEGKSVNDAESFTYLGSILSADGGARRDIDNRIQKARGAFARLRKIWRANNLRTNTKIKIFNACVKSVLLYGSETWLVTSETKRKLQSFINRCLRNILQIWWPRTITNEELWRITGQTCINTEIQSRKYGWIGHTLRKPYDDIPHAALTWNPQGTRRRGRPAMTWRRTIYNETGKSFNELRQIAQNRHSWKSFVVSLSS